MNPIAETILAASALVAAVAFLAAVCAGAVCAFHWRASTDGAVPSKAVCFVRGWKPFTDEEMTRALNGWNDTDPRFRALWDLIARDVEAELQSITAVKSEPHELTRWAGRLEALLELRTQLMVFRNRGAVE